MPSNVLKDDLMLQDRVSNLLLHFGIPASVRGYHYLREGIILSVCDDSYMQPLTKRLYPEIAIKFDTTSSRVERSIRHAITLAFSRGNIDLIYNYFGYSFDPLKGKATNSQFILLIADRLKRELNTAEQS